jgi:cytochrome c-type biogenesis protein CcmH/NrfF
MIAHTISDRVLLLLEQGKSEEEIMADLGKTKQAFKVAKKAYY